MQIILNEDMIDSWIERNVPVNAPVETQARELAKFFDALSLRRGLEYHQIEKLMEYIIGITIASPMVEIQEKYLTITLVETIRILKFMEGSILPNTNDWEAE